MQGMPINKPTPINLASHAYWNLGSHNNGDTLSHKIQIFGSHITSVNDKLIPTGEISPVNGTAYDFLKPREIESRIKEISNGYDINNVIDKTARQGTGGIYRRWPWCKMENQTVNPGEVYKHIMVYMIPI
ncbi:aldose 1-epimerase [Olea europaea subsp. europaea]|uniref:Aldose 1-epimerase n=1 Tax=Olea europaea subsp. europaea TaxID=158383 RepID=A0A8S0Q032_OLEEU|nr:aldose 1-epimerase [Olea europaea subsp. europaea]